MTEFFAQPDDLGELRASDIAPSWSNFGEQLGAEAGEAFMGGARTVQRLGEFAVASGHPEFAPGLEPSEVEALRQMDRTNPPVDVPMADAQARLKQEGVAGDVKLPDQSSIRQGVLDLMIQHAHERADYNAAIARGPRGFVPGALGMITQVGVGMIDPVNAAAFSVPVLGEARWGQMLFRAGDSLAARAGVRALQGAAQGAVGGAALVPGDWWLKTQDGQDYTMTDALKSVAMSAAMGATFHAGFGGIGDVMARLRGHPLPGSPEELQLRALGGDTEAADALERMGGAPPAAGEPFPGEEEVPGVSAPPEGIPPHPAEQLADLPPAAREDAVRAAAADVIAGEPVRAGEMLQEAAKEDPRIAESLAAPRAPGFYAPPDPFELAASGELSADRAAEVADRIDAQYRAIEEQLLGPDAERWRKLNRQSNSAWNRADDKKAREYDEQIAEIEGRLTPEQQALLAGAGLPEHSDPVMWRELARDLRDVEASREDAVARAAAAVRDVPATNDLEQMSPSQRAAMALLAHAMNLEKAAGRDPMAFLKEAFAERFRRYGSDANAQELVQTQMERLAALMQPRPASAAPARLALPREEPRIDNSHDIVSGANSSREPGGPVYVDRHIPQLSPKLKDRDGNPANLHKYLAIHEEVEADNMHLGYDRAHEIATAAERAAVEADGVDWKEYTHEIDGYLAKIEHEHPTNAPPAGSLHVDPNKADADHHHSSNKTESAAPRAAAAKRSDDNVLRGPRPARGPRARPEETWSLLEFLASRGGLRDDDPLIGDVRSSIGRKNHPVPGFGSLIRKPRELSTAARLGGHHAPMSLDAAREAAVEAGYLHDPGELSAGPRTTTVGTLLEAIDRELRGNRVYRFRHEPKASAEDPAEREHRISGAIDAAMEKEGIDRGQLADSTRARVVEILDKEGVTDPIEAIERAWLEEVERAAESDRGERIEDEIPGWDVPDDDDSGSAPPASGAPPGEPGPEGGGPGSSGGEPGARGRATAAGNPAAGRVADWHKLAQRAPEDPDIAAESQAADAVGEVASTDVRQAVSAAQAAATEADKLLDDILADLSEDERKKFEETLSQLGDDVKAREQIVREGAACLAAGAS